ncbi:TonB-dependent siderophore receptor [Kushneria aurantia]|uniref:TonB-dependent siderophore receptor n=1 Tax=Kushneria aurantia TaxID=504092 RepID=A0ABV6G1S3_9GAMM|nr:TonB-dependent siderophore receptor [Kushneria aurantia]
MALAAEQRAETPSLVVTAASLAEITGPTEGYRVEASNAAGKTATPLIETARSVDVITRQQLDDQNVQSMNDALLYTPGAFTGLAGGSDRSDKVSLRGFYGGDVDNTFLDGMRLQTDPGSYSAIQIDPFFLERIDVLKGPASALYGRAMPGGLVDFTSKRPLDERQRLLRLSVGNFNSRSAGLDLTGPVGDGEWADYRVTAHASRSDTQFDVAERERYAVMPQLELHPSPHTDLLLQAYLQHDPSADFHGAVPYDLSVSDERFGRSVEPSFSDAAPQRDVFERDQRIFALQLEHRASEALTFNSKLRYINMDVTQQQVYQIGFSGNGPELARYYAGADEDLQALSTDNHLTRQFDTGSVAHTLLAGVDYQWRENDVVFSGAGATPLDPFNPDYSRDPLTGPPTVNTRQRREVQQAGVYLQDQMQLGRWHLTLGGRQDYIDREYHDRLSGDTDSRSDSDFSAQGSLLYRFANGIAPYYSYSEAFNPSTDTGVDGNVPAPVESFQHEIGVKYQPPGSANLYTLALYDLTQQNVQQRSSVTPIRYVGVGDIRSRGLELSANIGLTERLDVIAGYSYSEVEYQHDNALVAPNIEAGNTPVKTPEQMASLWLARDFRGGVRGGIGARWMGELQASADNRLQTDDYTLVDAFVSVELGELSTALEGASLRLNAANLFDEAYVSACFSPTYCYFGDERSVTATLDYRF